MCVHRFEGFVGDTWCPDREFLSMEVTLHPCAERSWFCRASPIVCLTGCSLGLRSWARDRAARAHVAVGPPNEAYVPAEPSPSSAKSWLPFAHANAGRPVCAQAPSGEGSQASRRLSSLEVMMVCRSARLERASRLRSSRDFRRVGSRGSRRSSQNFLVLMAERRVVVGSEGARLGVTATRRVGKAVVRNRVKRLVRECFRKQRSRLRGDVDIVVIARTGAALLRGRALEAELGPLLTGLSP